jgi:hypothetical protein
VKRTSNPRDCVKRTSNPMQFGEYIDELLHANETLKMCCTFWTNRSTRTYVTGCGEAETGTSHTDATYSYIKISHRKWRLKREQHSTKTPGNLPRRCRRPFRELPTKHSPRRVSAEHSSLRTCITQPAVSFICAMVHINLASF